MKSFTISKVIKAIGCAKLTLTKEQDRFCFAYDCPERDIHKAEYVYASKLADIDFYRWVNIGMCFAQKHELPNIDTQQAMIILAQLKGRDEELRVDGKSLYHNKHELQEIAKLVQEVRAGFNALQRAAYLLRTVDAGSFDRKAFAEACTENLPDLLLPDI